MKNLIPAFILLFLVLCCRKGDSELQQIDQVVQLYIDSAGLDMLNAKIPHTYHTVALKDLGGLYDQTTVSGFMLKKDADTATYLEYLSGATRYLKDSTGPTQKTYESAILLKLTKPVNDSVSKTTSDTMKIQYSWTPQVFQVSKIYYNGVLKFTKTAGASNTVKIVK